MKITAEELLSRLAASRRRVKVLEAAGNKLAIAAGLGAHEELKEWKIALKPEEFHHAKKHRYIIQLESATEDDIWNEEHDITATNMDAAYIKARNIAKRQEVPIKSIIRDDSSTPEEYLAKHIISLIIRLNDLNPDDESREHVPDVEDLIFQASSYSDDNNEQFPE